MRREGPLRTRSSPHENPLKLAPVHGPLYALSMPERPSGQLRLAPPILRAVDEAETCTDMRLRRGARPAPYDELRFRRTTTATVDSASARHVPFGVSTPPCHGRSDLAPDRRVLLPARATGHESSLWRIAPNAARIDAALRNASDRPTWLERSPGRPHDGSAHHHDFFGLSTTAAGGPYAARPGRNACVSGRIPSGPFELLMLRATVPGPIRGPVVAG